MALETLEADFDQLPDDLCAIGTMDKSGDTKHVWKSGNPKGVEEARMLFNTLTKAGYRAFRMSKNGRAGKQMKDFDDEAEGAVFKAPASNSEEAKRILMVPAFQGG